MAAQFILHYPAYDNQVHNRASTASASDDLTIIFSMLHETSSVEARWGAGEWVTIQSAARGTYTVTLDNVSGQQTLYVRPVSFPDLEVTRQNIGIGDVFLIAGQSNASGRGDNNQTWTNATLIATMHANDYVWKTLADPTDSVTGQLDSISLESPLTPPAGSVWPIIANDIMATTGCPVAFIPASKGATSITQWARGTPIGNRGTLYGQSITRVYYSAGVRYTQSACRMVIWWQGEGDTVTMAGADYKAALKTLADNYVANIGAKLMATRLQQTVAGNIENVNTAIVEAAAENPNVLVGADLSDITTDDDAHLKIDAKVQLAGQRMAAAILTAMGY